MQIPKIIYSRKKKTLRVSSTDEFLGLLPNDHKFEFSQGY